MLFTSVSNARAGISEFDLIDLKITEQFSNLTVFEWSTPTAEIGGLAVDYSGGSTFTGNGVDELTGGTLIKELNPSANHKISVSGKQPLRAQAKLYMPPTPRTKIITLSPIGTNNTAFYSSLNATDITANSAVITWTTTEPSPNKAYYRKEVWQMTSQAGDGQLSTAHSVKIESLDANSNYVYSIQAVIPYKYFENQYTVSDYNTSEGYKNISSEEKKFTTNESSIKKPDLVPDKISVMIGYDSTKQYTLGADSMNFEVGKLLNFTATTKNLGGSYTYTDRLAPFKMILAISKNGSAYLNQEGSASSGGYNIWGWTPKEAGVYTVKLIVDSGSEVAESDESNNTLTKNITIIDNNANISNVIIKNITANSVTVYWKSSASDISYILFGTENSANGISRVVKDAAMADDHKLPISNLAPNTKYYFQIQSNSLTSSLIESSVYNFTTAAVMADANTNIQTSTPDTQIQTITSNAKLMKDDKFSQILAELQQLRDLVKEQQTQIKYLNSLVKDVGDLSTQAMSAINNFITYGVDANTKKLGAGERAAVINSYKSAFDKLPQTEAELADAIKIANGRFPSITSDTAEKDAKDQFVKIYKRAPDLNNPKDNAAIKVMAYGLRQKAENRNLNSEKAGIKIFTNIYGRAPQTTEDWNTMQAITYSGASR